LLNKKHGELGGNPQTSTTPKFPFSCIELAREGQQATHNVMLEKSEESIWEPSSGAGSELS